jgi:hypothetical protein
MSLTNFDLQKIARASKIPLDGVLNKDQLDDIPTQWRNRDFSVVINLMDLFDEQGNILPGSHWVGLYYNNKAGQIAYFDSFGFPPPVEVIALAKRLQTRKPMLWSKKIIQTVESTVCGYYALFFLYYISKLSKKQTLKQRYDAFINEFRDPEKNIKRMQALLKKYF